MGGAKGCFRRLSGQAFWTQIDKEKMRVGSARNKFQARRLEAVSQRLRIVHDRARIGFEFRPERLAEGDRLRAR